MNDVTRKELLKSLMRIRIVEERIASKYSENKMRCPTHLSIGQEAVPVAISYFLGKNDYAVSTHRGHAHYLAKGGNLNAMIAEIYGKSTGCSKGRGGSMHLIDREVGFMGTSAIVGNSIPVGVGLALSCELKNNQKICVVYLGDGAVEEGVFYESINFAILRNLRVLFVCENNLYSVYSPLSVRQPKNREISKMVESMGIKTDSGNGNDMEECFYMAQKAINIVRESSEPFFIEFFTYRHREHCGPNFDDQLGYRPQKELDLWSMHDPLEKYKNTLLNLEICSKREIDLIESELNKEVDNSFNFAETSPFPSSESLFDQVYSKLGE